MTWLHAAAVTGLIALLGAGCAEPATSSNPASGQLFDPTLFSGEAAMEEVRHFVGLGPRVANTPGAEQAADYLLNRFRSFGLDARVDVFEDAVPGGPATFRNVVARLPGTGRRIIILGSHYDTKAGIHDTFAGANDSGSSTGALLELARVMQAAARDRPADAEIQFVAFDGEEAARRYGPRDGFHGSRRFVRQLLEQGLRERVQAMILMDMIGDRDLSVTIPPNSNRKLIEMAFAAAREENARSSFSLFHQPIADDHVPFLQAAMPAVNLIDFAYGSAPGRNDYWHTEQDTLDKLSSHSLQIVGRVVIRMVNKLLAEPDEVSPAT